MIQTLLSPHALAVLLLAGLPTLVHATSYGAGQIRQAVQRAGGPEKFIARLASETTKMAGQSPDAQIELTASASLGKTMIYYLRLLDFDKAEIPDITILRQTLASRGSSAVCSSPTGSVLILEFSAEYKYIVYSKSREYLFEYTLTRETCAPTYRW